MESDIKLHPQSLQNPPDIDWLHGEDLFPFDNSLDELPPLDIDGFFDADSHSLTFHWDNILELETQALSVGKHIIPFSRSRPVCDEDATVDDDEVKPSRMIRLEDDETGRELQEVTRMIERTWKKEEDDEEEEDACEKRSRLLRNNGRRRKSSVLGLDEIQKHFHVPISEAAKEMNVCLTGLKRRCRQLNIMRWPHRKLKSLKSLIENVKEMGLTNEIKGLEEHKRLVEELPDMDLTYRTKRLRQACFKANYKKNRRSRSDEFAAFH